MSQQNYIIDETKDHEAVTLAEVYSQILAWTPEFEFENTASTIDETGKDIREVQNAHAPKS
jgi:hypothetical protein